MLTSVVKRGPNPRISPFYGDGDGDTDVEILGDTLGTGATHILGIYWGLSPKFPVLWGWGRG